MRFNFKKPYEIVKEGEMISGYYSLPLLHVLVLLPLFGPKGGGMRR